MLNFFFFSFFHKLNFSKVFWKSSKNRIYRVSYCSSKNIQKITFFISSKYGIWGAPNDRTGLGSIFSAPHITSKKVLVIWLFFDDINTFKYSNK